MSAGKVGGFVQTSYDGVSKVFSWDMTGLRFADTATIKGTPLVYGIDANNVHRLQPLRRDDERGIRQRHFLPKQAWLVS